MAVNIFTVDLKDKMWAISRVGDETVQLAAYERKRDALEGARLLALRQMPSRLIVHDEQGALEMECTFGQS